MWGMALCGFAGDVLHDLVRAALPSDPLFAGHLEVNCLGEAREATLGCPSAQVAEGGLGLYGFAEVPMWTQHCTAHLISQQADSFSSRRSLGCSRTSGSCLTRYEFAVVMCKSIRCTAERS